MRYPGWFKGMMAVWAFLGIPVFVLGQGFRGHFSLLPDPPPFTYSTHLIDQTFGTLTWAGACFLVYMPLFLVPALLIWRRRIRNSNAQN